MGPSTRILRWPVRALRYGFNQVLIGQLTLTSADTNQVGGSGSNEGNVVAGGIRMESAHGNTIQGNYVGTDATGTVDFGNPGAGIANELVVASGNLIGGTGAGEGNIVAFNDGPGVRLKLGTGSGILGNTIHSNVGLGIDLAAGAPDGVTPNDAGDGDTGPNNLQNFPVLNAVLLGDSAAMPAPGFPKSTVPVVSVPT